MYSVEILYPGMKCLFQADLILTVQIIKKGGDGRKQLETQNRNYVH